MYILVKIKKNNLPEVVIHNLLDKAIKEFNGLDDSIISVSLYDVVDNTPVLLLTAEVSGVTS